MLNKIKKFISRQFFFPDVPIPSSKKLSDFVVVVTGAGSGIGKAITEMVHAQGGKVVAASLNYHKLEEVFRGKKNQSLALVGGDVSIEKDAKQIIDKAISNFGRIDVLINNAGVNIEKSIEEIEVSEFDKLWQTNVKGAFLMSKYAIPHLKARKHGLILNIGSKISHNTQAGPHKVPYATTKYALEGFSFVLNRELKPFGLRVSCLMPGTVNTFVSLGAKNFLSPYQVAEIVSFIICHEDIDFEGLIIKSRKQNI